MIGKAAKLAHSWMITKNRQKDEADESAYLTNQPLEEKQH